MTRGDVAIAGGQMERQKIEVRFNLLTLQNVGVL